MSFCRRVVDNPEPIYVPVSPLDEADLNNCFTIVPAHVSKYGGNQILGWYIWEWPKVIIEAVFHTIWQKPDGSYVDITPKPLCIPRILFLPDQKRRYLGKQVRTICKPLSRDSTIDRLCQLDSLIYDELNRGELAHYHGEVPITPILRRYYVEKFETQNKLQQRYGPNLPEPMPIA